LGDVIMGACFCLCGWGYLWPWAPTQWASFWLYFFNHRLPS